jgi:DNA-binding GntR family transcriptional regulator
MSEAAPARIVYQSMAEKVAIELRRMVVAGEFEPGERLTQEKVAKAMGVSTMPVREALLRLAAEGLIIATPNRSFGVATTTPDDLRDIFWVYGMLAGELAHRFCLHVEDEVVETLRQHHQRYLDRIDDADARFESNWQFFRTINLAAHAPRLALVLKTMLRFVPDILRVAPGSPQHAARWQRDLLEAISNRDADKARAVNEEYARSAGELYIKALPPGT